ncbi:hypothetical protein ACNKHX_23225 [Shigella flexneri]
MQASAFFSGRSAVAPVNLICSKIACGMTRKA